MRKLSPKVLFLCATLAIFTNQSAVNATKLKCEYHQSKFMVDGIDVYYCDVKDNGIFTDARVSIDSIEGKHDIGIYDRNVNGLYINRIYSVKFLPRNLENIFGRLVMIHILDTNLQEITQDDLKVFPKLINLYLRGNKITTIDANLFEFNPELREIYLFRNQISHIDPNVFNHLNHLTTLYLRQNQCRKFIYDALKSRSQVLELVEQCQLIFGGVTTSNYPYTTNFYPNNPTGSNCICVTSGYCNRAGGSLYVPTDGSGLIDIRVLNNGVFTGNSVNISTSPAWTGITPIITSQSSCQAGLDLCCITTPYQCGLRFPPVAGAPTATTGQAAYGSYPWFAMILQQSTNTYVGSGALIDHMHILTVAHKVNSYVSNPSSLKIRMGEWNFGALNEPIPPMEFTVTRIFLNSQFNSQSLSNSIAILRVSPNVPLGLTPTITTACLSTNQIYGTRCWLAGYGNNGFVNGVSSTIQAHVDLPLVEQTTCQNQLRTTRLGSGFILDTFSFACAGGHSGRDACTGDGGSPLVCQVNAQWYVVGLVAWGIGCGTQNVPGVYMNVTNYISWIQSQTIQA